MSENWKFRILQNLQNRNRTQTTKFQQIINEHNRLYDLANQYRHENLQLSIQNEKLRTNSSSNTTTSTTVPTPSQSPSHHHQQQLEQKLIRQQEELTELLRWKSDNSVQILTLTERVQQKDGDLLRKDMEIAELRTKLSCLNTEAALFRRNNTELMRLNDCLRDEYRALQLMVASLEEKLRSVQSENCTLQERVQVLTAEQVERMNEDSDSAARKRYASLQKEIEDACRDSATNTTTTHTVSGGGGGGGVLHSELVEEGDQQTCIVGGGGGNDPLFSMNTNLGGFLKGGYTNKCLIVDAAHEGEVNAVRWSPVDRYLATGGSDRKLKLWEYAPNSNQCTEKGALVGSNAGLMSIDFNAAGTYVVGASNDYACRLWSVTDMRLRQTLTGHSGKVMAAKFFDVSKIVTGSHDRTLKVWDLRSRACMQTKFAGSSCNDLVTFDTTMLISAHFDKKCRYWDTRQVETVATDGTNIGLNGKITSLDLTRDGKHLICCVRDDSLNLIDIRMHKIIKKFEADGFKVGCDWSRVTFSPNGKYCAVGSSDGGVYIWNVLNGNQETVLRQHTSSVTATSWHQFGTYLATVENGKKLIIWRDIPTSMGICD